MDHSALVLMHMGALHPVEQALTVLLAFGPFVVLGLVLRWRRRSDAAEAAEAAEVLAAERAKEETRTPGS
ncbi:hypothetical protein [Nocardioides sp.]|uniref:hypothetical protein n=1 Tax=Nocardioides sp. TaxID=35761 RepID=UPI003563BDF2